MPIEFRCTGCQRLLRTADDTTGKPVKCPECGVVMAVPKQSPIAPTVVVRVNRAQIRVGDVFRCTWTLFRAQWTVCVVAFLVLAAIYVVIGSTRTSMQAMVDRSADTVPAEFVGRLLVQFGSTLISTWIGIGQILFMLNLVRGRQVDFLDLLRGGPFLARGYIASILLMLIGGIAFVLMLDVSWIFLVLAIPGIVLWLTFSQCLLLIVDRNVGVIEGFALSRELTQGNKATLLMIIVLAVVIGVMLVIVTLGLAIAVVGPCLMLLPAVIYLALTGELPAGSRAAAGPSLSDRPPPKTPS